MKLSFKVFCFLYLFFEPVMAENFSFMLSNAEQQALGFETHNINTSTNPVLQTDSSSTLSSAQTAIFLSGILYFSSEKWTIWLNNQPIHQLGKFEDALIKSVSADHIILNLPNDPEQVFCLRPNQSLIINSKKIMDGDKRPEKEFSTLDKNSVNPTHKEQPIFDQEVKK